MAEHHRVHDRGSPGFGVVSERGGREYNEDSCSVHDYSRRRRAPYACFMAMADGMGGHQAGDVASHVAIQMLERLAGPRQFQDAADFEERAEKVLWNSFSAANSHIYDLGQASPEHEGMGTTLTCALVGHERAHIAHVGDSRAYIASPQGINQVTEDHSIVGKMVTEGVLTEVEAQTHAKRNILTRAIGPEPNVEIDILRVPVHPGEILFMCSDGLYSTVNSQEIYQVLVNEVEMQGACARLVELAIARGSDDNVSATAWRMPAELAGAAGARTAAPGSRRRELSWWAVALIALLVLAIGFGIGWGIGAAFLGNKNATPATSTPSSSAAVSSSSKPSSSATTGPADSTAYQKGTKLVVTLESVQSVPLRTDYKTSSYLVNVPNGCTVEVLDGPYPDNENQKWYHVVVTGGPPGMSEINQKGFLMEKDLKYK